MSVETTARIALWFGDERGYNATFASPASQTECCGLVMKEDITQRKCIEFDKQHCCGLVMKEDITQQKKEFQSSFSVVVW